MFGGYRKPFPYVPSFSSRFSLFCPVNSISQAASSRDLTRSLSMSSCPMIHSIRFRTVGSKVCYKSMDLYYCMAQYGSTWVNMAGCYVCTADYSSYRGTHGCKTRLGLSHPLLEVGPLTWLQGCYARIPTLNIEKNNVEDWPVEKCNVQTIWLWW